VTKTKSSSKTPPTIAVKETKEAACQTLSTGDIVITKIFFKEDQDKKQEKIISSTLN
jgi:exonuclease 3'-5' domain-containing protein 1